MATPNSKVVTAACCIGVLIVIQGLAGLAVPDVFVGIVRVFQAPPVIYLAAVVRFAFGATLVFAAPASRAPTVLMILGALIAVGGLLTPFFGIQFAEVVLRWWADVSVVRWWAGAALILGAVIVYATAPKRRPA